jgi:hypothetical protein
VVAHIYSLSYTGKEVGGSWSYAGPRQKLKKKFKNKKRASNVAEVVEYLPSNCKALSSNPVPPEKKEGRSGLVAW